VVSLSQQGRYTGHTHHGLYSIAQHSVLVANHLPPSLKRWGLLHDASEAYLCDLPTPLKRLPEFAPYREAEQAWLMCIAARYELDWPIPHEVEVADKRMLVTEMRDLMFGQNGLPWEPYDDLIIPMSSGAAMCKFARALADVGLSL